MDSDQLRQEQAVLDLRQQQLHALSDQLDRDKKAIQRQKTTAVDKLILGKSTESEDV